MNWTVAPFVVAGALNDTVDPGEVAGPANDLA